MRSLLLILSISIASNIFAQPGQGVLNRKAHIEAVKLVERVIKELPGHLGVDAAPIIVSLYDEYLIHFLGQNAAEDDSNTIPSVLRMSGEVNAYFKQLVKLLAQHDVNMVDPNRLNLEMRALINNILKNSKMDLVDLSSFNLKLKESGLRSGVLYYIAETVEGGLLALEVPNDLGGVISIDTNNYLMVEQVFNSYLGREVLTRRGYHVKDAGLMVVTRSDKYKLNDTSPISVRSAIAEQRQNKITNVRIKAERQLVDRVSRMLGDRTLILEVYKDDFVSLKNAKLNKVAPDELRPRKWVPQRTHKLHLSDGDVFSLLSVEGDQLLMFPYDSFSAVVDMMKHGAADQNVKSILITLYRTADGDEAEIVKAVEDAIRNGKEVTVILEARARGNELPNLDIMGRLNEVIESCNAANRVKLIYQTGGMKVHAKLIVFERFDGNKYAYIPTGNLHEFTAGIYTDLGLFTADQGVIDDVANVVSNINHSDMSPVLSSGKVFAAPWTLRRKVESLIKEQILLGSEGKIVIKANVLTDPSVIKLLEQAKLSGVEVHLIIRERSLADEVLEVKSILGPFLEHMRLYQFGRGEGSKVYMSSGDPSRTKMDLRYELLIEISDTNIKNELVDILDANIMDTKGSWVQEESGYKKVSQEESANFSVQEYLKDKVMLRPVPNISSTYSSSEIDDLLLEVLSRGEEISDELIVDIFGTEESESGLISYLYSHLDEVEDGKEIALLLCSYFGSSRAIDHRYITLRIIKTYQFLGLLGLDIKGSYERLTERLSSLPQVLDMEKFNQMVVSQRSTITRSIIK